MDSSLHKCLGVYKRDLPLYNWDLPCGTWDLACTSGTSYSTCRTSPVQPGLINYALYSRDLQKVALIIRNRYNLNISRVQAGPGKSSS